MSEFFQVLGFVAALLYAILFFFWFPCFVTNLLKDIDDEVTRLREEIEKED